MTAAKQIAPGSFGIYIKPDGTPVALNTGVHYDVVPSFVNVYKVDEMRYRTLKTDVHYDPSNSPGSAECFSELCGTPIDKIAVAGTQRLASFNVDVGFKVMNPINNPDVLAKYVKMGSLSSAMVNYIEGPTREAVRSVGADMTQPQLESEAGKAEYEKRVLNKVQGRLDRDNIPLQISYVNVRGRDFNDADLRTAAAAAELQLQKENDRIAAANAHTKAIEAETAGFEALQRQITLKMDAISKVINTSDGISCTELALLGNLGLMNVDWSTMPKEMCVSGNTAINVTTAPK